MSKESKCPLGASGAGQESEEAGLSQRAKASWRVGLSGWARGGYKIHGIDIGDSLPCACDGAVGHVAARNCSKIRRCTWFESAGK